MMEVGVLRGKSAEHVRSFCAAIGPHWIPVVAIEELAPPRGQSHPALSGGLLEFIYRAGPNDTPITLINVIDSFATENVG